MQATLLLLFQRLSSPFLDTLVQAITFFGEETLFIIAVALLLWCFSKQRGFTIFSTLFAALIGMSVLKAIVKYPRPFQVLSEIEGKRLATATGYSFPSGHTTGAAAFYSSVAFVYRKRWLSIVSALLILLVGLSRIYLGVHWPLDVFAGLMLGIVATFTLSTYFHNLYEKKESLIRFSLVAGVVTLALSIVLTVLLLFDAIDAVAYSDPMKLMTLAGTGYLGFAWEQRYMNYTTEGSYLLKLIRLVVGLVILFGIQALKALLGAHLLITLLRYALIGIWVTALYPYVGAKVGLFKKV